MLGIPAYVVSLSKYNFQTLLCCTANVASLVKCMPHQLRVELPALEQMCQYLTC